MLKFTSRLTLLGARIDRESGVIKGVSLIALGDARGHGKGVDQKTLETVRDCATHYGEGLRVKFNPNTFTHGAGSLAGFIPPSTLRIKDGKLVGDLHVYDSFPSDAKEYLHEIAERTPGNIGLSIEFTGEDEEVKGEKFARCEEIFAATIVDLPAANPTGLFSAEDNANSEKDTSMTEEQVTKLTTQLTDTLKAGFKEIRQMFQEAPPKKDEEKEKEEMAAAGVSDSDDEETKKTKLAAYRASLSTPVAQMSAEQLGTLIAKANMQFFRQTGGTPARPTVETDNEKGLDPFEKRVRQHLTAGAHGRGVAIMRARRDAPNEYNAWRAKQNPNVQRLQQK